MRRGLARRRAERRRASAGSGCREGGSLAGVGQLFAQAGVPLPAITGPANVLFEFVGGIAMILGPQCRSSAS